MNKILIATTLGITFGIICAGMSMIFKPVGEPTILGLIGVVFNRALIGFLVAETKEWKRYDWLRAILIGILVSYTMTLPFYGLYGFGFAVFGVIYAVIIYYILKRF